MPVPNQFANVTTSIPLSQLDANFNTPITLGNTAIQLGNTVTTLNNMTLANVTISSGNVTITNVTVTTANVTTANIGTSIITTSETLNYGTANQVQYLNASKVLTGSANLTFDGTTLTPHTLTVSTGVLTVPAGSNTAPSITTSGDTNTGIFYPAADTVAIGTGGTERLRVDSAGNLGLGVTPSAWATLGPVIQMGSYGAYIAAQSNSEIVRVGSNNYYNAGFKYVTNGYASFYSQSVGEHIWYTAPSGTAGNAISFTQAMTLDASGNLGIGSTPVNSRRLTINTSGQTDLSIVAASNNYAQLLFGYTGADSKGIIAYYNSDNSMQFYTNGAERARITSGGNFGVGVTPADSFNFGRAIDIGSTTGSFYYCRDTDATNGVGGIGYSGTDVYVVNKAVGNIRFFCNPDSTERARITSAGEFWVAGTTDQGAYNIQCNGTGVWGAGAYVNGSDARIKENIAPITSSLDVVTKLNPVTYRYKEDWSKDQSIQTGFIAQELLVAMEGQNYVDGVVQQGGSEGYYSVAYQNIIPLLTKAIQELKAELDATKAEVALLKGAA